MFGKLGQISGLIKQAQEMQGKMKAALKEKTVEASAGGGMVTVTANGLREVLSITIEKEVIDPADSEMLEDLVAAAVNQALKKAEALSKEELSGLAGGLPIPGLDNLSDLMT